MNVTVLGASGRAGSEITRELASRGHTVTAVARKPGESDACEIQDIRISACAEIFCAVVAHSAPAVSGAGGFPQDYCKSARINSAARSPIMILGALVLPETRRGMMLASATYRPSRP